MRIGFVELLLILLIASLTIGPSAALWVVFHHEICGI